jgi:hypothetical protein
LWALKKQFLFKKVKLASLSRNKRKIQRTGFMHHVSVPLETTKMLSEACPDAMDNKAVISGVNVKSFTLYIPPRNSLFASIYSELLKASLN